MAGRDRSSGQRGGLCHRYGSVARSSRYSDRKSPARTGTASSSWLARILIHGRAGPEQWTTRRAVPSLWKRCAFFTIFRSEIPGTDRHGEFVMVGAHLDSWQGGTGAVDNAAGCAIVMEALRVLHDIQIGNPRHGPARRVRHGWRAS